MNGGFNGIILVDDHHYNGNCWLMIIIIIFTWQLTIPYQLQVGDFPLSLRILFAFSPLRFHVLHCAVDATAILAALSRPTLEKENPIRG